MTETEVNFCAQSFKTVDFNNEDAPALTVLGSVLRNGYLHTAIREKGGIQWRFTGYEYEHSNFFLIETRI